MNYPLENDINTSPYDKVKNPEPREPLEEQLRELMKKCPK